MGLATASQLRFASAVTRAANPKSAGHDVAQQIRRQITEPIDLAFLFFSSHYAPRVEDLSAAVREALSPRIFLGCSGEGIIAGSEEIETAPAVTLWAASLPDVDAVPLRLSFSPVQDQLIARGWPEVVERSPVRPVFVILADPFSTPMRDVLSMLQERYPGAIVIGGLAGGGHDSGENRLLFQNEAFDGGLVGASLSGPLSVHTVISQGCRPVGDRYVVTKAEHNVIHELSGIPALECLQTLFDSFGNEQQRHAQRAVHLGIVINEHLNRFERGDFLVRNLIGADQRTGAIAIGELIQEGQTVQFHLRDARSASEDLNLLLAGYRTAHRQPPLGALLFSCCGRGQGLFGQPHHDARVLRERLGEIPVAGFFAQGEIGPVGGSNFVHGYTASVALFSKSGP